MWNVKAFCCIWQWWCEVSTAKQCTHKIKSTTGTVRYTNSLKNKVDEANFHLWWDSKAEVWKLTIVKKEGDRLVRVLNLYSQLSPCGHPAITDTPIKRTVAKSPAKTNYRRLTEINSRYYGLSLMRTRIRGPYSVRYKGSWMYFGGPEFKSRPDRLLDLFLAVPSSNPRSRL